MREGVVSADMVRIGFLLDALTFVQGVTHEDFLGGRDAVREGPAPVKNADKDY